MFLPHRAASRATSAAPETVTGLPVRWARGRPVVLLSGDVDLSTAAAVAATGRVLRRWQRPAVVDASAVSFMDVAGLRAVLALAGPSGSVELRHPSPAVLRLLEALERAGAGIRVTHLDGAAEAVVLATGSAPA